MQLTPVERRGPVWMKREDLFSVAGTNGAVARDVLTVLAQWKDQGVHGVTTSGGMHSSQIVATAAIARMLGMESCIFVPEHKKPSSEIERAAACGAQINGVQMGYPNVVAKRARDAADNLTQQSNGREEWRYLRYAHQIKEAIHNTAAQVANLPREVRRIVTAVGNGMTTCGVAAGLAARGRNVPILGIVVGSMHASQQNVKDWLSPDAQRLVTLVPLKDMQADEAKSGERAGAHSRTKQTEWYGVPLDPYFEAKVAPYLQEGHCLWIMANSDAVTAGDD